MRSLLAVAGLGLVGASEQSNSQLQKVISLLEGMMEEGKNMMNQEQVNDGRRTKI